MTSAEYDLLDLLVDINGLESRCKTVEVNNTISSSVVFEIIQSVRDRICDFGIIHVVKERNGDYDRVKLLKGKVS